jgi:23S rRNA (cytidine1920-2'-O)/16S rRNA (cytidine1409-2'-O)-methyltransferase
MPGSAGGSRRSPSGSSPARPETSAVSGRVRLDTLLVTRGLAPSRERARALILAGQVRLGSRQPVKAGTLVAEDAAVALQQPDHPYVSRGGLKLAHALDAFGIDPTGARALDVGASTGGFTDVLLRRGATRVVALDVGHGQIDWRLRTDPRVVVLEKVNARALTADQLAPERPPFDIVTVDVSFISLRLVLPPLVPLLSADGHLVALVKPQFEAGREDVGAGGIVRDPVIHARVVREVVAEAARLGLAQRGLVPSPIEGAEGNREFLLHLAHARDTRP